jgi:hypothetical protein
MKSTFALFIVMLLAFGCISSDYEVMDGNSYERTVSTAPQEPMPYDDYAYSEGGGQYVTKESYMQLKVPEGTLESRFELIKGNLSSQGAETTDISYNEYSSKKQYHVTIKVSPGKFDSINDMLKEFGEVKDMSVTLEDVTKQYTDLETRIRNKENELTRLNQLYNQSESVSEILEVERELTRVETELELLKWQKDSIASRVAKSTISLTVYEEKPAAQNLTLQLENLAGMFFGAIAAAITLIVVAVGFLLPVAVVLGAIWFGYKFVTKPRKPSASRRQPQQ